MIENHRWRDIGQQHLTRPSEETIEGSESRESNYRYSTQFTQQATTCAAEEPSNNSLLQTATDHRSSLLLHKGALRPGDEPILLQRARRTVHCVDHDVSWFSSGVGECGRLEEEAGLVF